MGVNVDQFYISQYLINERIQDLVKDLCIQNGYVKAKPPMTWRKIPYLRFGDRIKIIWDKDYKGMEDIGLVTPFPGQEEVDANINGLVWIEHPDNPGGKENATPEWISLYQLETNPYIKEIQKV